MLSGERRTRRARLLIAALVLGLALGAAEEAARQAGYAPDTERIARFLGFGIDQVTLKGHRFSYDRDVFDTLDLANVRTFAALDTAAVKARIERLPWIDTAELTRVYPGRLDIRVTERKPYALWQRADRLYLIDKTGRVLAAVNGETLPDLPRFAGEGAAAEAASLMETIARYPEVAGRLAEAERISERRWRLKLDNNATLELPADGEVGALEELARDAELAKHLAAGLATLDFRGPGRVAIRPAADTAASASAANPGS
ncbi:cell division protein FtsQ/DivIB [Hyphomicrobium sp.]|uniref:cell division protein FtsQ/DivIB n=1 Tax=Hyphomicrobium sp. TaxID=82 RepID=UPI0025BD6EAC|nr:cell division protein FtsQ/DivIB [Hyphomicrobium sp.]MCC7252112.1 FtsQ-type POTRA domain-containing protein [Hyphomicrobium sp.]